MSAVLLAAALMAAAPVRAAGETAAAAGSAETRRREAQARYDRGVQAYAAGRYREAVARFLEADAVLPSAPLSYNIALAYENLSEVPGALRFYRDYLRRAPTAANAAEVQQRVAELERQLAQRGVQQITVRSDPPGATVFIDDRPLGVTPWTGELTPGSYRLTLVLPEHAPAERRVRLTPTHSTDVNVVLGTGANTGPATEAPRQEAEAPAPPIAPRQAPPRERAAKGFGPWPWVTLGAGGAALAAAGIFELRRQSAEDGARNQDQIGYAERYEQMQSHQLTARILAGVGGALLVTGGALVLLAPAPTAEPRVEPRQSAGFGCLPSACYGSVTTSF